jgi:OmcA/MtrC family decaheme c-type cytochrome
MKAHWKTLLAAAALAAFFSLAGCEGDDGADGADGAVGPPGPPGEPGEPGEPAPVPDPVLAAIEMAKTESCSTCHEGIGEGHQAIYDSYVDASRLGLTITAATSAPGAALGTFDLTVDFSVSWEGAPFNDLASLDDLRFLANTYDSATGQYSNGLTTLARVGSIDNIVNVADGDFVLTATALAFDPTVDGQVYGYLADGSLFEHVGGTGAEIGADSHVHIYDDVANAAIAFGAAAAGAPGAYQSLANVGDLTAGLSGCVNCHGEPYLKHGFRDPIVAGLPDFGSCKSCHVDDRGGFHPEWQYMVDDPLGWATGADATADYSYNLTLMNDVHMSHAMEFPYPQSMAGCNTCHEGNIAAVLDDSNFAAETCKSCHAVEGIDAWPKTVDRTTGDEILGSNGRSQAEKYYQGNRAPALAYLWWEAGVDEFHNADLDCQVCHTAAAGIAPVFSAYHTGYNPTIYDESGVKYADAYTVSIENVTRVDDLLTVEFSASDTAIVPELLISFYGWDSKHFLVNAHERDSQVDLCTGSRPGCKMEYVPESSGGSANPLFTEDAASVPGAWIVTLDMSVLQPYNTADIPTLIAEGKIRKAEISLTPELELNGTDVVLEAVDETFDLDSGLIVDNYFKDTKAAVDIDKCNACHDVLASSFHDGSGRGGDGIEVCKNCHATTYAGSHLEMASRSIDNYVHAIHSFQDFDPGDTFETFDPVLAKRYDQHIKHVFPNFTIRNCEACHVTAGASDGTATGTYPVTYNVPDQSQSMPGLQSATDDVNTWYMLDADDLAVEDSGGRNIVATPQLVTGPASRSCGGCHRARLIRDEAASDLASFNAHTESFGTLVENDALNLWVCADGFEFFDSSRYPNRLGTDCPDGSTPTLVDPSSEVTFGIIEKIMSMFE